MDKDIIEMLKMISEDMQRTRDRDLKNLGLTFSQMRVLLIISQSKIISQKDIENKLFVSHSATHGIIKRLHEKNYIKAYNFPGDKRQKLLALTDEGTKKIQAIGKKLPPNPLDILNDEEKKNLKQILNKLIKYTKR